ncbi:MAG: hypothetical protein EA381_06385 [Planctomycetaceae bacterium]|nr:MAG: hypothetical protein EA381_06385 [Planctomycetaceae bacterium]
MRTLTGIVFIAAGVACLFMFRAFFVLPAFTRLPDGGYGELYGPVSFFRIPIYGASIFLILVGASIVAAFWGDN